MHNYYFSNTQKLVLKQKFKVLKHNNTFKVWALAIVVYTVGACLASNKYVQNFKYYLAYVNRFVLQVRAPRPPFCASGVNYRARRALATHSGAAL